VKKNQLKSPARRKRL